MRVATYQLTGLIAVNRELIDRGGISIPPVNSTNNVGGIHTRKCHICGMGAAAIVNGKAYVCDKHAEQASIAGLTFGQPIILARRGDPQNLVFPTGGKSARRNMTSCSMV